MTDERPSADPTPALELLWGTRARPRRGPRQGLTLDRVVGAAVELADAEGAAAVSMRRVAARLGVGAATLYTYVPGRTELCALMLDAVIGRGPLPHEHPGGWRAGTEAWAREDWAVYRRRPWVLRLADQRTVPGPNFLAWYDSAVRLLEGTGLDGAERLTVVEMVDGYVRGLARSSVDAAETELRTGVSEREWAAATDRFLEREVDFGRYPALAAAMVDGAPPTPEDVFAAGLRRLLDGIEADIAARTARR
ncbi:TetR/AcrR family transcriptional regulator [Nocardiopsis trehalosi]|jgi:AcrR family transcriptional regulator|uniref:TetR/AcrR family transcriptional regulator n=1 Tax=Nocardiopsis trehalosi TaxID=109329 RepID=UPI0008376751|nr:TetR/AcrR family transcriptional regulator [Nocardiopsis trehalosi]